MHARAGYDNSFAKTVAGQYLSNITGGNLNVLAQVTVFRIVPWEGAACYQVPSAAAQASYRRWVDAFAAGIGSARVALILQPDLPFALCSPDRSVPLGMVAYAARRFNVLAHTTVYIDAGAAEWSSPGPAASLLAQAGVRGVRGFALNATQDGSTALELEWGARILESLGARGIRDKHFVINTAQNGAPFLAGQYPGNSDDPRVCASRSDRICATLGIPPTWHTSDPRWGLPPADRAIAAHDADAYLWISRPWLTNGATVFSLSRALGLGANRRIAPIRAAIAGGGSCRYDHMGEPWTVARGWRPILWPSLLAAALPFLLVWLPPARWHYGLLAAAGALTLAIVAAVVGAPWERLPQWGPSVLAFAYLIVVVLLRAAGGPSGVTAMVLLPVFWLGLCGTQRQLLCLLVGVMLLFVLPLLLVGGADYPASAWRAGILFVALSGIVGMTMHSLVSRVREQDGVRDHLLQQLDELAHTDVLTGLPNRRAWELELDRGLSRARRTGEALSVAMIDIDSFKAINDLHGHSGGDSVLIDVAGEWAEILRPDDVLARIGGDEFAVLLPACPEAEGPDVLERLRARMSAPTTCSVGLATWDGAEPADRLMVRADTLLYDAKRARHVRSGHEGRRPSLPSRPYESAVRA